MNTSEFAKLCGVQKRTLFHYDQIRLLCPVSVHENGYREYSKEQVDQMDMIKIFQSCGYSLAEIKSIMNADISSRTLAFQEAGHRIEEQIRHLSEMQTYVKSKQQLLEEFQSLPDDNCLIQNITLCFEKKPISIQKHHTFCFLMDGAFASFILEADGQIVLCQKSSTGPYKKEGRAITFFLSIPSSVNHLQELIKQKLEEFQFEGEDTYYVENMPHFLLEKPNSALLKVIVFER